MLNTFFYQMILNAKLDNNKIKKRKKKTKQNFNQIRPKTRQKKKNKKKIYTEIILNNETKRI